MSGDEASPKRKTHSSQRLLHLNSKSKTIKCNTIKIKILQNTRLLPHLNFITKEENS